MLQLQDLGGKSLTQVQNGTTTKLLEVDFLRDFLTNLIVGLNLLCLCQRDFLVLVLHLTISNHDTVAVNLKVTLVGVHNHVEVLIRAKNLGYHITETLLKYTNQCGTINVLGLLKLLKGLYHRGALHFFLCNHYILFYLYYLLK